MAVSPGNGSAAAPFIQVQGLHFAYPANGAGEPVQALLQVDLQVRAGEWLALVGGNGSGKSTLARCLNGLLLGDTGDVHVDGLSTRDHRHMAQIRRRLALVFQNPDNQIVAPVVEDDVAFGPENLGVPPGEMRERVRRSLAAVGLTDLARRAPAELSGGQKQRLAIAGALAMEPAGIILDEATSMLDPVGRGEVMQAVRRLHRERGLAVVWITHDMAEAAVAQRVVVLAAGRVVADGTPQDVLVREAELAAWGLDAPPAVPLAARLRGIGMALPNDIITMEQLGDALCPLRSSA